MAVVVWNDWRENVSCLTKLKPRAIKLIFQQPASCPSYRSLLLLSLSILQCNFVVLLSHCILPNNKHHLKMTNNMTDETKQTISSVCTVLNPMNPTRVFSNVFILQCNVKSHAFFSNTKMNCLLISTAKSLPSVFAMQRWHFCWFVLWKRRKKRRI